MPGVSMTSRQRVLATLNFQEPDRLVCDLGAMASTGISAFAYPGLVSALGLSDRRVKVHDTWQMLGLPDLDVLDALGCDVVSIFDGVTNAFFEPDLWCDYDFAGRLDAMVGDPGFFSVGCDGTIIQQSAVGVSSWSDGFDAPFEMSAHAYVFNQPHAGQQLDLSAELPMEPLASVESGLRDSLLTDIQIARIKDHCRRVRQSTDRAVFYNGPVSAGLGIASRGGIAIFPMLCLTEPNYVLDLHDLIMEYSLRNVSSLLSEIHPYIDIIMAGADDWGTQNSLIASPAVYGRFFAPYYRRYNDLCHKIAPEVKTFLHSCGAIYDLLDAIIASGFDVLNPVQWSAGQHSYREWKDKCRNRIALWGGGVNSQSTLPLASVDAVVQEVCEVVSYLKTDGGYVFGNTHNILAEIPAQKVIAMYRAAASIA